MARSYATHLGSATLQEGGDDPLLAELQGA